MRLDLLVEGYIDEAVARRLVLHCGHEVGTAYGKKGWNYIEQKINAFDRSCGGQGLLTLVDFMDTRQQCAPVIVRNWLPRRAQSHVFRVVMREIESWVLADRPAIAEFLAIPLSKVPLSPESLGDPKQVLVNLARGSRSKLIKEALVPETGHATTEGPLYSSEIVRFVTDLWDPEVAGTHAPSLNRCLTRLNELHG